METSLRNCKVPWSISPSASGVTLIHEETDVAPNCRVVLGGGRLQQDGRTDWRRIELVFELAYFTRTTPHDDSASTSDYGFDVVDGYDGDMELYVQWRQRQWTETGLCPNSGFYIAESSDWLDSIPNRYRESCNHYLLDGGDGHVELLASNYRWAEWAVDENIQRAWSDRWPLEISLHQSKSVE